MQWIAKIAPSKRNQNKYYHSKKPPKLKNQKGHHWHVLERAGERVKHDIDASYARWSSGAKLEIIHGLWQKACRFSRACILQCSSLLFSKLQDAWSRFFTHTRRTRTPKGRRLWKASVPTVLVTWRIGCQAGGSSTWRQKHVGHCNCCQALNGHCTKRKNLAPEFYQLNTQHSLQEWSKFSGQEDLWRWKHDCKY